MIKKNQEEFYKVIDNCNNVGNSTEFIEFMLKMINNTIDETTQITTQQTTQQTTQEKILTLIRKNPRITQTQLAKALGITRDGVSYNIKQLKDNGLIKRIVPTKNGHWIVK